MIQSHNSQNKRLTKTKARSEREIFERWYRKNDKFVLEVLLSLLSDFHRSFPRVYGNADYARDQERLIRRFNTQGIRFAAKTLDILSSGLLDHLAGRKASYPGFLLSPGRNYPAFLRRMFALAYNVKHKYHVEGVRFIYQFGAAFTKIKGPARQAIRDELVATLIETDQALPSLPPEDSVDGQILINARGVIKDLFHNFDIDSDPRISNAYPTPGPGSTNIPVLKHLRFRPETMYSQIDNVLPYERWFYPQPSFVFVEDGVKNINSFMHMWAEARETPTSRFKDVPKKYGKLRGICMEVNEMQVAQQMVKNAIVARVESHEMTKGFVNFSDQGINGSKALAASLGGGMATLDEKEASDRVPRTHVQYLFQDHPRLAEILMALSTRVIEFKDKHDGIPYAPPLHTKKYAPMGSALCFPVLALYNFSIIKGICRYYADLFRDESYNTEPIYVYGDDIIVPDRIVGLIFRHIPAFGLKINETKSFYTGSFRESCGVHAYKGEDITPVYFKYTPSDTNVESLLSAIAAEYQLYNNSNRYQLTARCMRQWIQKSIGRPLPFVRTFSSVLGFLRDDVDTKYQLQINARKIRWDAELQTHQARMMIITPLQEGEPPYSETDGYLRRLVTGAKNPGEIGWFKHANVKGRFQRHKIQWKWVYSSEL